MTANKNFTLYVHIVPNGKYYIGITCQNVRARWGTNGLGYFNKHRSKQSPFYNAILKYGWDNIQHIILLENLSRDVACECEKYLIAKYDTTNDDFGYNLTLGGEGAIGLKHSKETKALLSKSLTGRHLSDEHKQRISNSLKGRSHSWQLGVPLSDETKQKLSNSLKGHIVTEATKEKIRIANTGNQPTEEMRKKMSENNGMHRPEIRQKVSDSLKKSGKERAEKRKITMQEKYPNGFKHTERSKQLVSEKLKGRPKSEETKQKMRKPKSPEAREHMRIAQIESHRKRKEQKDLELTLKVEGNSQ